MVNKLGIDVIHSHRLGDSILDAAFRLLIVLDVIEALGKTDANNVLNEIDILNLVDCRCWTSQHSS